VCVETSTATLTSTVGEERDERLTENIPDEATGATELHDHVRRSGSPALSAAHPALCIRTL
jgi:hypothetical protein